MAPINAFWRRSLSRNFRRLLFLALFGWRCWTFTCPQHRVFSDWLREKGAAVPPESWLATSLLWRAQRLGLTDPLHRSLVAPYLPGGSKQGAYEEMYALWRAAGLFDAMRARAAQSATADLTTSDDYDKFLNRWLTRLRYQVQPFPAEARSALNFAIETYGFQMEDPAIFQLLENHTAEDEKLKEDMEELKASVPAAELGCKEAADLTKLKGHDALFVGHSNFHVQNPYQPWEDVSVAICKRFKEQCTNPLYNDIGFYHAEDLLEDLFDPKVDLEPLSGQFELIAGVHLILNEPMLQRLRKLLKPGGIIIWNTWFRHQGEYPGTPPDLQRLGFEAMRDEELPLSFVSEPFQQAGFKFRFCYTRKTATDVTVSRRPVVDATPITVETTGRAKKASKKGFA